jgi:hypothetical protein
MITWRSLFSMDDWRRFENHRIDQTEDRGIGSNAERERQNRDGGKSRPAAKGAQRIANILQKGVEHIDIVPGPERSRLPAAQNIERDISSS